MSIECDDWNFVFSFFSSPPGHALFRIEFRKNVLLFRHSLHDTLPTDV